MAKDDYFKIVYIILSYLYESMKKNKKIDEDFFTSEYLKINDGYIKQILINLKNDEYIDGFKYIKTKNGNLLSSLDELHITTKGIEYLQDNNKMKTIYNYFKEIRDWL